MVNNWNNNISSWWFQAFFTFHFIYGLSSFPLTNSIIFQDGFLTTKQLYMGGFSKFYWDRWEFSNYRGDVHFEPMELNRGYPPKVACCDQDTGWWHGTLEMASGWNIGIWRWDIEYILVNGWWFQPTIVVNILLIVVNDIKIWRQTYSNSSSNFDGLCQFPLI